MDWGLQWRRAETSCPSSARAFQWPRERAARTILARVHWSHLLLVRVVLATARSRCLRPQPWLLFCSKPLPSSSSNSSYWPQSRRKPDCRRSICCAGACQRRFGRILPLSTALSDTSPVVDMFCPLQDDEGCPRSRVCFVLGDSIHHKCIQSVSIEK